MANTYLIPHVHTDRGPLTQLLQTLPAKKRKKTSGAHHRGQWRPQGP